MQARGAKVEDVLVDVREEAGSSYLERASVAIVRDGVIEHYVRAGALWGRRLDAMVQLAGHYAASKVGVGITRSFSAPSHGEMHDHHAAEWKRFCQASDHLSPRVRSVVEDVARGKYPAAQDTVARLRDGAQELADYFRLFPDKAVDDVPSRN